LTSDQIYSFGHSDPKKRISSRIIMASTTGVFLLSACWNFCRKPPGGGGARDVPVAASRKDDGVHAPKSYRPPQQRCTPTRRRSLIPCGGAAGEGDLVANLVLECTAHTAPSTSHLLPTVRRSSASLRLRVVELLRHAFLLCPSIEREITNTSFR
jgi:hypothetical protein